MGYRDPSRLERLIADFTTYFPSVPIDNLQERMQSAIELNQQVKGFSQKSVKFEKAKPSTSSIAVDDDAVLEAVLAPSES